MELNDILGLAVKRGASDIHIKVGMPPIARINGSLNSLEGIDRFKSEDIDKFSLRMMRDDQRERFEKKKEIDLAYSVSGLGRFRVNVFQQRGTLGMVFRVIPTEVPSFEDLNLPENLKKICMEERGFVLVTGATGCGKSTTLASMIEYINTNMTYHIVTIEDPIEFLVRDKKSIITQREVGIDTNTFAEALKSSLRQDPDVILVGEMRDLETMSVALTAAETGHLVLSTLHTVDATEAINRIISVFPPHQHHQIRLQLAAVLKGIISQRLVTKIDGKGRVPAVEVMITTARIRELIIDSEKTKEIYLTIAKGFTTYGMQTFDQSLMWLVKKNLISLEEAITQSSNPDDFRLRLSGITSTSDLTWEDFEKGEEK